ncbi:MAG TPA: glycosyltransferase family 4 protein [Verrucomicrobiales bacterium]|nr:glycosyltransferase family 4 protein [Verrucomicrobiales bacterium]
MRIIHLTPGTGNFHCGSCHRDNYLMKAMRRRGHDVTMVPLYLPLVTDGEAPNPDLPVFAGGINLFLKQKLRFFRKSPRWLQRMLDSPMVLRLAAKFMGMTSARQLGEMTVESFKGVSGKQAEDWQTLIDWIGKTGKPEVLSLSNGLLNGLAVAAQRELGVPVVCSLQGEDTFLDTLPEPWREQSWQFFRENSAAVTRYVATSEYYAATMRRRLGVAEEQLVCVRNGLDLTGYERQAKTPEIPVIGYLARQCTGKGLHTLVDAFILLAPKLPQVRLAIAGTATSVDNQYVTQQQRKLKDAGLWSRVTWKRNLSIEEKLAHLQSLTVLSVPATYGEAFGLYVVEALACGVPVVEPDHAGLGELLRAVGGGLLCIPDDAASLAERLSEIITDPALRESLAEEGHTEVLREFSAERMARDFERVCEEAGCAGSSVACGESSKHQAPSTKEAPSTKLQM